MKEFTGSYVTVPSAVVPLAAAQSPHRFAQFVIVQPVTVQFVPLFPMSQRFSHVIHPGSRDAIQPITELVAEARLLVKFESPHPEMST